MPKPVNCCVPGCFNNFRNSTGLQYYRIPKDSRLRTEYVRLIRNKTLKLNSDNTRICSEHFEGGRKMNPDNLPSIFPWTKAKESRRQLIRKEPLQRQNLQQSEPSAMEMETTTTNINEEPFTVFVDEGTQCSAHQPSFVDQGTQTEVFGFIDIKQHESTILELNHTIERLTKQVNQLNHQLQEFRFDIDNFKDSASDISFYTGFSDYETLMLCYSIVEESSKNLNYGSYVKQTDGGKIGRRRKLSNFQEFIMVLVKLRLGLFNRDLAYRFKVSENTVSLIFRTWIRFLRVELEPLICLPPREVLRQHMPPIFKLHYPKTALIIDCTEFEMERPSSLDNQSACYSQFKSRTTMKELIGTTASGVTAFASELYPGSISDKEIVKRSGLLEILQPGDEIMADKGFLIKDELASVGATLVLPKFLQGKKQFNKEEAAHNKKVASLPVHVESCMERIKNWHILDRKLTITSASLASDIVVVLSAFTNFYPL